MLRSMIEKYGKFTGRLRMFERDRISGPEMFDRIVDQGVIDCYEPAQPIISRDTPIVAMGSCFAQNVSKRLAAAGYNVLTLRMTDRLFTPYAIQTFVEGVAGQQNIDAVQEHWKLEP